MRGTVERSLRWLARINCGPYGGVAEETRISKESKKAGNRMAIPAFLRSAMLSMPADLTVSGYNKEVGLPYSAFGGP